MSAMRRAIFLDRDGTLNLDRGYVHKKEEWEWLPGALEGLRLFKEAGWLLVVCSNQSGIGRGYYGMRDLSRLEDWVNQELQKNGCPIEAWYYCPHLPDVECDCRKPKPGLILRAARDLDIDPGASWMIGDRLRDVEAGIRAGCRAGILANENYMEEVERARRIFPSLDSWPDLLAAAKEIVADGASSK